MKRVVTFLLAAGLVFAVAAPATAAPPSSDPKTDARDAAAWIAERVNASGFIPSSTSPTKADLSSSAQAVTALAAAGVGKSKVTALLAYLGSHIDAFVAANGFDDPGAIAYLILAAKAGGADPTSFGPAHADLVTRLVATQQPDGLFGLAANATFTGAFDEGLSLLALHAAGIANPHGVTWLEGQQCADGSFTAFRADTTVACPAVNTTTFVGPDTNSTALALLGLIAQGDTTAAAKAEAALRAVRNAGGGWGFFSVSTQATDGNSTGLVLEALRTVSGVADQQGIRALLALQVGCAGAVADRGGIAFQPDGHRQARRRHVRDGAGDGRVGGGRAADHLRDDLERRPDALRVHVDHDGIDDDRRRSRWPGPRSRARVRRCKRRLPRSRPPRAPNSRAPELRPCRSRSSRCVCSRPEPCSSVARAGVVHDSVGHDAVVACDCADGPRRVCARDAAGRARAGACVRVR